MGFDNEYDFIPLAPMTYNSMPQEMKDFICTCGMFGTMPGSNLDAAIQRGVTLEVNSLEESSPVKNKSLYDEEDDEKIDAYVEQNKDNLIKEDRGLSGTENERDYDNNLEEHSMVEKILRDIECNNPGIFKFLELNGIPYVKAKKFIKRVIRLTLMY